VGVLIVWAISPNGIGERVGARRVNPGWELNQNETFVVDEYFPTMVLDSDGLSLRYPTPSELAAMEPTDLEIIDSAFSGRIGKMLFDIIFDIQNRLAAVEGSQPISKADLKAQIKTILDKS